MNVDLSNQLYDFMLAPTFVDIKNRRYKLQDFNKRKSLHNNNMNGHFSNQEFIISKKNSMIEFKNIMYTDNVLTVTDSVQNNSD
jgi:hypothetical protein